MGRKGRVFIVDVVCCQWLFSVKFCDKVVSFDVG